MEAPAFASTALFLATLSEELAGRSRPASRPVPAEAAGVEFNLASPNNLGEAAVRHPGAGAAKNRARQKRGLEHDAAVLRKTRADHRLCAGAWSTATLSKLKSTMWKCAASLVEPEPARVTPYFNQAVTATGRLSSSHPNLQNIPIRTQFSAASARPSCPRGLAADQRRLLPDRAAPSLTHALRRRGAAGGPTPNGRTTVPALTPALPTRQNRGDSRGSAAWAKQSTLA